MGLNIIKNYLTRNRCYQQAVKRKAIGIQIHTIGTSQGTAKAVCDYWDSPSVSALVHYICDADVPGKVYHTLPDDYYAWADGGYGNRNLITIEICESDFMKYTSGASYYVTSQKKFEDDILRGYDTAVQLCAKLCTEHKWDPMAKLPSGLYLISSHYEGNKAGLSTNHVDPVHVWNKLGLSMDTFRQAVKNAMKGKTASPSTEEIKYYRVRKSWTDSHSQLGAYESLANAKANCPAGYFVFDYLGAIVYENKEKTKGTQASVFEGLSESDAAEKILSLARTDTSGILYSVTAAQMILESGYGTKTLAKSANNFFGMKANLSGNTWASKWDSSKVVKHLTQEVLNGKTVSIYDDFRKYDCIEDSIADHAAYLLGAMNGSKKRYDGLLEAKDYKEAITIIKNGGYATDPNYISKVCALIQRFGLNEFDKTPEKKAVETPKKTVYRVQLGVYKTKANAVKKQKYLLTKYNMDSFLEEEDGSYFVYAGSYDQIRYAKTRVSNLKNKYGIAACIKEKQV